ncbi:exodeoxyribonuclease VII small subunit [Haematomicrobium sanguinis]|uniref:exodeoxyribonuclease VII small subunit n=1 Tax=Haematomicrobium sanguinis TaxID=479106 RepID=UPI0004787750|nr:exodeoxyribonuclease VII small subunit [Haematomicrobium sanguinis]
MAERTTNTDVAALSYEEAREELVAVVSQLETGGATLEQSLQLWERGEALANRCESWLSGARERIEQARPDVDGELVDDDSEDDYPDSDD